MNTPAFRFATITAGILLFLFARPAAAGTMTSSEPVDARGLVAVVDAQFVTMENERVLDHQSIIIGDGQITQIGPASGTLVLEGALARPLKVALATLQRRRLGKAAL
jgi:hypothetical protein